MTTLIRAGLALPLRQAHGEPVQSDFGVCVEGATIVATGSYDALRQAYPTAEVVGGVDYCLLPGMVNSHDHGRGLGTLPLGVADDLLEVWLPGLFTQPGIDRYHLARYEGQLLLRSGVCTTAHSHNPLRWETLFDEAEETLRGYGEAGIRVAFHPPMIDQNPLVYAERERFLAGLPATLQEAAQGFLQPIPLTEDDYFRQLTTLYHRYHDAPSHKAHIQVSPAGGQWCSDALILRAVDFARQHKTRVQMHMLETQYQRHYAYRRWGKSFIQHLADIGALGPWLTLAHMVWLDDADLPLLAAHGVGVAHNPSSNLRLRSGVAPVPALLDAGVLVGVGLDGQALDDDQDYLRELRLAWTLANRPGASARTVTAPDVWQMGTTHGHAITFGPEAPIGTLVPGTLADLLLLDWGAVQGVWASPVAPPLDLLLRRAKREHVRHVMVHGQWVVRDGRSTRVDEGECVAAMRAELARFTADELAANAAAALALAPYLRRFYAAWDT
jgi:cytosine/adenosine deaminase-related metal-dependent hydrolase